MALSSFFILRYTLPKLQCLPGNNTWMTHDAKRGIEQRKSTEKWSYKQSSSPGTILKGTLCNEYHQQKYRASKAPTAQRDPAHVLLAKHTLVPCWYRSTESNACTSFLSVKHSWFRSDEITQWKDNENNRKQETENKNTWVRRDIAKCVLRWGDSHWAKRTYRKVRHLNVKKPI